MDIDSLQIKIASDSSSANKAISNLINSLGTLNSALKNYGSNSDYIKGIDNLSGSFKKLSDSVSTIDTQKLKEVSTSVRSIGKSFKSLNENINSISFTKLQTEAKAINSIIDKETRKIISDFGIEGRESVHDVNQAFEKLAKVVTNGGIKNKEFASSFNNSINVLRENARFATGAKDAYADLVDYIKKTNSAGAKVFLPFEPSEFINDYSSMRATLGKAFTSDSNFAKAGQDLASYVSEMNDVIGTTININQSAEGIFNDLVSLLRSAKNEFIDYGKAIKQGMIDEDFAMYEVDKFSESINKQNKSIQSGNSNISRYENTIENLVENVNKLNGIQIPDFTELDKMTAYIRKLGGVKIDNAIKNIPQLSTSLQTLISNINSVGSVSFNVESLSNLVSSISKIGNKKVTQAVQNLPELGYYLNDFVVSMNNVQKVSFETGGLTELVKSIGVLGGKSVTNAINNLPLLNKALSEFIEQLSKMPSVSQNLIDTVNAIANLSSQGQKVGSSIRGLNSAFSKSSKHTSILNSGFKKVGKSGKSLAAVFGKIYASYWMFFRAFGKFKESINLSADLTEVQNVVNKSFGNMTSDVEDFAKTSIETFGMSVLSAKQFASQFQAMGNAMGITNKQVESSNKTWSDASGIYNNAAKSMSDISINLTKLSADMGSFFNQEYDVVAERLASGVFQGQSRSLRVYGIDLTQATLKEWALTQGIEANFKTMTQAEKTMLRYQYVMAHANVAMGDFRDTAQSWSNQVRLLKENFKNLGSTIGGMAINSFKPLLIAINQLIVKFNQLAIAVSNSLGKIFGWKYEEGTGVAGVTDDVEDMADGLDEADGNAKKLKKTLAGFDELNVLNSSDSGSGSGDSSVSSAASGTGAQWVKDDSILKQYESNLDTLYKLGDAISNKLSSAMEKIDWDKVYSKAKNFGKGLADFLNGLITPRLFGNIGKTIANTLNTVISSALSFGNNLHWKKIGNSFANGLNKFFMNFNFSNLATGINVYVNGLLDTLISFTEKANWNYYGYKIGEFISKIDFKTIFAKLGKLVWKAINGAIDTYSSIFSAAPIETAIISSVGLLKFTSLGSILSAKLKEAILPILSNPLFWEITIPLSVVFTLNKIEKASIESALSAFKDEQIAKYGNTLDDIYQKALNGADSIKKMTDEIKAQIETKDESTVFAETLLVEYEKLREKTELTAGEQELLYQYQKDLIECLPELQTYYNEETKLIDISRESIEKLIEAKEKEIKLNAIKEQWTDSLKKEVELQIEAKENANNLALAQENLGKWTKKCNDELAKDHNANLAPYQEDVSKAAQEVEALSAALSKNKESLDSITKQNKYYKKMYEDINTGAFKAVSEAKNTGKNIASNTAEGINENSDLTSEAIEKMINNAIQQVSNATGESSAKIGENIVKGIAEPIENPDVEKSTTNFKDKLINFFKTTFQSHSPAKAMYPLGENIVEGIAEGFKEKTDIFDKVFKDFFEKTVKPNLSFTKWSNILDGFKNAFKTKFNDIIAFAEKLSNCVVTAVNHMIDSINKISFTAPSWAGGRTIGFNIPKMGNVTIPRLAQGAVIPPNQEFLALLGDQKKGTNIEAPLDTIVKAFETTEGSTGKESNELLRQILQAVIEKETGIRKNELFESVRKSAREFQNATGRLAF